MKALASLLLLAFALACHADDRQPAWLITAASKEDAVNQTAGLQQQLTGLVAAGPNGAASTDAPIKAMFASYMTYFGKRYSNTQAQTNAYNNFKANLNRIATVNANLSLPYWLSGNNYSDMSFDDFKTSVLMANNPVKIVGAGLGTPVQLAGSTPTDVNWVTAGKVNPIKDQGQCGSCWAFSGTSVIESAYYIATGAPVGSAVLSEQQIVSCLSGTSGYTSQGCNGGLANEVINYVSRSNQTLSSLYPYVSGTSETTGTCKKSVLAATSVGQVVQLAQTAQTVTSKSKSAMMNAVAGQPVTIYFEVDNDFQSYAGGVYSSTTCGTNTNHAMVAVGYSTSASTPYWLIRNSWGTSWGLQGYVQVQMTNDGNGMCGMYLASYYPTLSFTKTLGNSPAVSPPPATRSSPPPSRGSYSPPPPAGQRKKPPPPAKKSPSPRRNRPPPPSNDYDYDYDYCADYNQYCSTWASYGYCSRNSKYYSYMYVNCPASCNFCS